MTENNQFEASKKKISTAPLTVTMLFAFMCKTIKQIPSKMKTVSCQVNDWIQHQPWYIKVLFGEVTCET